ncbi:MAG: DUF393 domain-containing protein [Thiotrichales bacterium]|nr:DUF393 domain-containing protein [Thiotrichales bacterium]
MIKVFFDDQCGLCSKEIAYYQRITPEGAIEWLAISEHVETLANLNIDLVTALKHIHAIDADQNIHLGVDAFVLMWSTLPRWRVLAKVASIKPINWLLKVGYEWFAKWRFNRSKHCQIASQQQS